VVRAAAAAKVTCRVGVIDNDSTDESRAWLTSTFPQVQLWQRPNRGLCSFNDVLPQLDAPVAILLNNDIRVEPEFVDRLIEPLNPRSRGFDSQCFLSAPLCWHFDGQTCEGFKTAVRWQWGLVQATGHFAGHEHGLFEPGLTASAGAALAVDRQRFLELGGFDSLYLPGRIEDLDFAYRGYLAGYHARYVPAAVCHHQGMATFGEVYGKHGCDALALRNTLLFQWKNLRHPRHRAGQIIGAGVRLSADLLRSPAASPERRWQFFRALKAAWQKRGELRVGPQSKIDRQREWQFFQQFAPERMSGETTARPGSGTSHTAARGPVRPVMASVR
jgi:GT2 family glycosyltransferase